jgi:hypothetical protein
LVLASASDEGNMNVWGSSARISNDYRRCGAASESTACSALGVDVESVDLAHD